MKEHSIISLVFGVLMDWLKRRAREKPRQQTKQPIEKQKNSQSGIVNVNIEINIRKD